VGSHQDIAHHLTGRFNRAVAQALLTAVDRFHIYSANAFTRSGQNVLSGQEGKPTLNALNGIQSLIMRGRMDGMVQKK
jgi:hypothetical protein